jgi:RNA polymerase sigma-70 factor (ECF subfamily)
MDDQEHVREVYAASAGRLVAQLFALTGDFGEAQDVVHEAFARALARPGRLNRVDNPEAWLRTVAVNLARSRYRRRAVFDRLVRSGRVERPSAAVPGLSPDRVALVTALRRLPHLVRESLVLHHFVDLPVAEIAEMLGCSPSTVKARLVRGRRALSDQLADAGPDPAPPRDRAATRATTPAADTSEELRHA